MITKKISVSGFKAHCTEEIRKVEKGNTILELTRHGKKVAVVTSADAAESAPDLENWIDSGKGTVTFGPNHKAQPSLPVLRAVGWIYRMKPKFDIDKL